MNRFAWTVAFLAACHPKVSNDADARYAYLGLDSAVDRAMNLGMDGFNAASSANIDDQQGAGDADGTMVVSGQVDQGASDNKELRLEVAFSGYRDQAVDDDGNDILTVYDTPDSLVQLDISLKGIPDGTFDGTFVGTVVMSDGLEGDLDLDLALAGSLQAGAGDDVERVPGSTTITGTATSDYGVFDVDLTH
jgi:hypothetical protein